MRDVDRVSVEAASESDAAEITTLYLASRAEALPFLRKIHTDLEVSDWVHNVVLRRGETSIARLSGRILGFVALVGEELDQLYVLPGQFRRGIGRQLMNWAKARSPERLWLYTFQRNQRARAFYESQGFRKIGMSDGERNEECEPDICYEWTPAAPATQASVAKDPPLLP